MPIDDFALPSMALSELPCSFTTVIEDQQEEMLADAFDSIFGKHHKLEKPNEPTQNPPN